MYKRMAEEAEAEGFADIARKFRGVAEVEAHHEARFSDFKVTHLPDIRRQEWLKADAAK